MTEVIDASEAGDTLTLEIYRYYDADGILLSKYEHLTFDVELKILD